MAFSISPYNYLVSGEHTVAREAGGIVNCTHLVVDSALPYGYICVVVVGRGISSLRLTALTRENYRPKAHCTSFVL